MVIKDGHWCVFQPSRPLIARCFWYKCTIDQLCLPSVGGCVCHPLVHTKFLGWNWLCGSLELETCIFLVAWLVSLHTNLTLMNRYVSNYRSSSKQLGTMLCREMERQRPCGIGTLAGICRGPPLSEDPFLFSPRLSMHLILCPLLLQGNILQEQSKTEHSLAPNYKQRPPQAEGGFAGCSIPPVIVGKLRIRRKQTPKDFFTAKMCAFTMAAATLLV